MFYSAYISEKLKSPFQTNIIHPTCREAAKYYLGELILYYNTNNISRVPFNIYKGGINLVVRQQQGRGGGGGGKDEKKLERKVDNWTWRRRRRSWTWSGRRRRRWSRTGKRDNLKCSARS